MCILEKLNFKTSWRSIPPDLPSVFAPSALDPIFARLTMGNSQYNITYFNHTKNFSFFTRILEYLWQCLSTIESRFSNCGLLIVGDFNHLKTKRLQNSFGLKQLVNFPARGKGFLDWVFTNLAEFHKDPIQRPSHGLSDHMSVELQPRNRSSLSNSKITIKSRDLRPSNRLSMRTYLQEVDAHTLVSNADSCEEKTFILESIIQTGLNSVLPPLDQKTVHSSEPP